MAHCIRALCRLQRRALASVCASALLACSAMVCAAEDVPAQRSPTPKPGALAARVSVVAAGLEHPWGIALLPEGGMLVTERPGRLRRISADGKISEPLAGIPKVYSSSQGGLLDVELSPNYSQDRLVYFSFAEPGAGGAGTAVARGKLGDRGLENTEVIWRQQPKVDGPNHWGSRLVFARDGTLFVTLGERFSYRDQAQNLAVDARQSRAHRPRWLDTSRQSFCRTVRSAAGDMVLWPSQCASGGFASANGGAMDCRAWRARRR